MRINNWDIDGNNLLYQIVKNKNLFFYYQSS